MMRIRISLEIVFSKMSLNMSWFQEHGISSRKNYNDGRKDRTLTWSSNDSSVDQQELFRDATYNFTEIVKRIYIRFIQADTNGKVGEIGKTNLDLKNKTILEDNLDSIQEQRHRGFGRCYTFYPKKEILDLGVYYIKFYL